MPTKLTEKKIRSLSRPKTQRDILHEKTPTAGLRLAPSGSGRSRAASHMKRVPDEVTSERPAQSFLSRVLV